MRAPTAPPGTTATTQRHGQTTASGLRPPGLLELEELLSAHLDTRVSITMGGSRGAKGKVTVEFATLEDLERIYRAMTSTSERRHSL